jgi:hypothetical protein
MTADFTPSQEIADAFDAFTAAQKARDDARDVLRVVAAKELEELRATDRHGNPTTPTNKQVADFLSWSEETVRGIAREFGVKPKRAPTVKSIKPARRTKPTN